MEIQPESWQDSLAYSMIQPYEVKAPAEAPLLGQSFPGQYDHFFGLKGASWPGHWPGRRRAAAWGSAKSAAPPSSPSPAPWRAVRDWTRNRVSEGAKRRVAVAVKHRVTHQNGTKTLESGWDVPKLACPEWKRCPNRDGAVFFAKVPAVVSKHSETPKLSWWCNFDPSAKHPNHNAPSRGFQTTASGVVFV